MKEEQRKRGTGGRWQGEQEEEGDGREMVEGERNTSKREEAG